MDRLPTITSAQALIDAVDRLNRRPLDRKLADRYGSTTDAIRQRLIGTPDRPGALRREQHGTVVPDGYASSTMNDGPRGTAESTTVEAAVIGRTRVPRDVHRELTMRAIGALDAAVANLNTVMSALASIDDLIGGDVGPQPKTCAACHPVRDITHPIYARGTVGGRLAKTVDLCRPCWDFVATTAPAKSGSGRLPTHAEVAEHERRGRWRVRVVCM